MPSTWNELTATGAKIGARSPADFRGLDAGPVPPAAGRMQEARDVLRRKLTTALSSFALRYAGPNGARGVAAFFDAVADRADVGVGATPDDGAFAVLVEDAVANAYRFVYFDGAAMSDADLWSDKRRAAERELNEAVAALVAVVPFTLGADSTAGSRRRSAGAAGVVGLWDRSLDGRR